MDEVTRVRTAHVPKDGKPSRIRIVVVERVRKVLDGVGIGERVRVGHFVVHLELILSVSGKVSVRDY